MTRISPINDFFFRYLFGKTGHESLTLNFINSVLANVQMGPLSKITIRNPFNLKESVTEKETILDIKAEDDQHHLYNIEMQVQGNSTFAQRSVYYWAKTYVSQLKDGSSYKKLLPVICINVHDFQLFRNDNDIHSCYLISKKQNPKKYSPTIS